MAIVIDSGTGSKTTTVKDPYDFVWEEPDLTWGNIPAPVVQPVPTPTITQQPADYVFQEPDLTWGYIPPQPTVTNAPGDYVFQEPNLTWGYIIPPSNPVSYIPSSSQQAKVDTGYGEQIQSQAGKIGTGYGEPITYLESMERTVAAAQEDARRIREMAPVNRRIITNALGASVANVMAGYGQGAVPILPWGINPEAQYGPTNMFSPLSYRNWLSTLIPGIPQMPRHSTATAGLPVSFGGSLGQFVNTGYGPFIDLGEYTLPLGDLEPVDRETETPTPQIAYSPPGGDGRQVVKIGDGTPGSYYRSSGSHLINWRI